MHIGQGERLNWRESMVRTYCKIIGTREKDYAEYDLGQGINQEMTVFSGGAGVPYTEEMIRASRDVFQLYGGKTAYASGVFSSVMRSIAGQAFVCYGISQKQALGRDAQFTQLFVAPREDLLDGDVYMQEVLGRNFVNEAMIHRATRPTAEEVFTVAEHPRSEVNQLSEHRLKVLMHAVVLLCNGRKVLLVERDKEYQKDFFRPLLRELFELIPAGHRYQIDFTTGRCLDDLDRLGSAQLIVSNQLLGGTPERPQLCLDDDENLVRIPNTRVWPSATLSQDGRNEFHAPPDKPDAAARTMEWTLQTNAQRDELTEHDEYLTKTLQTDFMNLMDCMDEEKSFWWKSSKWNKSIKTLQKLVEMHESTYVLGKKSYNAQFCARLPALLDLEGGVEELYFDFMQTQMTEELRKKYKAYIRVKLQYFGMTEQAFNQIETNYENYDQSLREVVALRTETARQRQKKKDEASALLAFIQQAGAGLFQRIQSLVAHEPGAQPRLMDSAQEPGKA